MKPTIGVLTSGGDAPGMNAAIRAIVRSALFHDCRVVGIKFGYRGLINNDMTELNHRSVANIIQRGGTILGTARCDEFETIKGMRKAWSFIQQEGIDAVIAIGGDGTMRGAHEFSKLFKARMVGLPGTIDNDLYGADFTIGFDTAVNSALEAIDRIRDTASSLERLFFVEVMGRYAGFIGLAVGMAGGAEEVLIPETPTSVKEIARMIIRNKKKGKHSNIVIVSEGDEAGNAIEIARKVKKITGEDYRVAVLGYIQRGGSPTANDRILGSRLGYAAVEAVRKGRYGCLVGMINGKICHTPFSKTYSRKKGIDPEVYKIIKVLSM